MKPCNAHMIVHVVPLDGDRGRGEGEGGERKWQGDSTRPPWGG